jgi:hypothetical protein
MTWLRQAFVRIARNRRIVTALWVGGGLLLLALAFWAGVAVGTGRPSRPPAIPFGRAFGDPRGDMAHGAFGSITRIDGDTITIMDPRFGQPRTISISPTTLIESGYRQRMNVGDLRVGENITVIGSPLVGETIQARFIGVVDQQPLNLKRFHAPLRPGMGGWLPAPQGGGPYDQGS